MVREPRMVTVQCLPGGKTVKRRACMSAACVVLTERKLFRVTEFLAGKLRHMHDRSLRSLLMGDIIARPFLPISAKFIPGLISSVLCRLHALNFKP